LLLTVSGHHGGVPVQCDMLHGYLLELPAIQIGKYRLIGSLTKLVEESNHGLEIGQPGKAKQLLQDAVMAHQFGMFQAIAATPDAQDELGDELVWAVASIAPRSRQSCLRECMIKVQPIKHLFHHRDTTLGGDFFVCKTQLKVHDWPGSKKCNTYAAKPALNPMYFISLV